MSDLELTDIDGSITFDIFTWPYAELIKTQAVLLLILDGKIIGLSIVVYNFAFNIPQTAAIVVFTSH